MKLESLAKPQLLDLAKKLLKKDKEMRGGVGSEIPNKEHYVTSISSDQQKQIFDNYVKDYKLTSNTNKRIRELHFTHNKKKRSFEYPDATLKYDDISIYITDGSVPLFIWYKDKDCNIILYGNKDFHENIYLDPTTANIVFDLEA